jgi:branched-subunit amino acid transport protein AzlD
MAKAETILQIAHIFIFITIIVLAYGAWKVALFKNQNASLFMYVLGAFLVALLLGILAHLSLGIKTKFGYFLGLCEYPKYQLY